MYVLLSKKNYFQHCNGLMISVYLIWLYYIIMISINLHFVQYLNLMIHYSQIYLNRQLFKTHTSLGQTPRVCPCLSLLLLCCQDQASCLLDLQLTSLCLPNDDDYFKELNSHLQTSMGTLKGG